MIRPAIYSRPAKPLRVMVKSREDAAAPSAAAIAAPVIVDKATECHVTPSDVAARMVQYLGHAGDYLTLEPSAGTGQIARALLASGHSVAELVLVERHIGLAGALHSFGAAVINQCFLEYAAEARGKVEFPRIIMNPPFSDARKHIAAARALLGRGGHAAPAVLVALVPVTFPEDGAERLETLPDDTFATARVVTKIIRFYA